jgi:hypothetical protein
MGLVRSDDSARMLRFPWMGPASAPFGFQVRFPVVGLFVGLMVFGWVLDGLLAPSFKIGAMFAVIAVPAVALYVTRRIAPHLTPDKPIGYHLQVLRDEARAPRPPRRKRTR